MTTGSAVSDGDSAVNTIRPPLDKRGMAKWFGCSVRTVEGLMAKKELPFIRLGGRVLFDLNVVSEHLARRCKVGGPK